MRKEACVILDTWQNYFQTSLMTIGGRANTADPNLFGCPVDADMGFSASSTALKV